MLLLHEREPGGHPATHSSSALHSAAVTRVDLREADAYPLLDLSHVQNDASQCAQTHQAEQRTYMALPLPMLPR